MINSNRGLISALMLAILSVASSCGGDSTTSAASGDPVGTWNIDVAATLSFLEAGLQTKVGGPPPNVLAEAIKAREALLSRLEITIKLEGGGDMTSRVKTPSGTVRSSHGQWTIQGQEIVMTTHEAASGKSETHFATLVGEMLKSGLSSGGDVLEIFYTRD